MSVVSPSFRARVRSSIETPVANVFGRLGLTPNALTLIGFGIALAAAVAAAGQAYIWAGLLVAFGAIFDLFDGALARATNKTSKFGAFMDSTFDRAGEAVVYAGIVYGTAVYGWWIASGLAAAAMAGSFMVSYTRAKSESLGFSSGTGMANVGLAPREVRIAILAIGLVMADLAGGVTSFACIGCENSLAFGRIWIVGSLGLITVLATVTTIQRILFVYRQSSSNNQEVTK